MTPLVLLGGTFDPIHHGHLRVAEEVADALGAPEVQLVPAGQPPHRASPGASAAARLAMCRLAVAGNARLRVNDFEVSKPTQSYTVETLEALRAEQGGRPLCWVVGADAFAGLSRWHRWRALFDLAHFVVVGRPGNALGPLEPELALQWEARQVDDLSTLSATPAGRIFMLETTALAISASEIRALLGAGRSARYLAPDAVLAFAVAAGLYAADGLKA